MTKTELFNLQKHTIETHLISEYKMLKEYEKNGWTSLIQAKKDKIKGAEDIAFLLALFTREELEAIKNTVLISE